MDLVIEKPGGPRSASMGPSDIRRQALADFASCGTILHEAVRRRLSLIVVVLGYSRYLWARFRHGQTQQVVMECLKQAFHVFGGVPKEVVFDNLKPVVARPRSAAGAAVIQPSFAPFAEHWGFEPVVCPPYWSRAKGKVARAIGYIKRSFLEGRS